MVPNTETRPKMAQVYIAGAIVDTNEVESKPPRFLRLQCGPMTMSMANVTDAATTSPEARQHYPLDSKSLPTDLPAAAMPHAFRLRNRDANNGAEPYCLAAHGSGNGR